MVFNDGILPDIFLKGMVWYRIVYYGMVWYGMVWYGMVWYGMVWYGMVWYGIVWYGMVWYDILFDGIEKQKKKGYSTRTLRGLGMCANYERLWGLLWGLDGEKRWIYQVTGPTYQGFKRPKGSKFYDVDQTLRV